MSTPSNHLSSDRDKVKEALKRGVAAELRAGGSAQKVMPWARDVEAAFDRLVPPDECVGAHRTTELLWPGTAHQGVICRDCRRFLPC